MKAILVSLLFIAFTVKTSGQNIISSNVHIETCVDSMQCVSLDNSGYLFYDETKTALYLKINFRPGEDSIKSGDSIVEWLKNLSEESLYFKVVVPGDFFKGESNYNQKELALTGQVFLNGFWQPQTVDIILFTSENGNIAVNAGNSQYDNFKISFNLSILPEAFQLYQKQPDLHETLSVGLSSGRINQLRPGMEGLLGDAYNHN